MSGEATPREVLIAAGLSSTLSTADDGWPSIVSRSNEEAADLALAALSAKRLSVVPTDLLSELLAAARRTGVVLIAASPHLQEPFSNAPDQTPWTHSVGPAVRRLYDARRALVVWTENNR